MTKYTFPVPASRGFRAQAFAPLSIGSPTPSAIVRDIILHALIVRIAYADDHTEEFLTRLGDDGILEIDIPQERLDNLIADVGLGPKLKQFLDWLTGDDKLNQSIILSTSSEITSTNPFLTVLVDASDGPVTIVLPGPSMSQSINVKKIDSTGNVITILPPSGTIDGENEWLISIPYESFQFVSDNTNFFVV